LPQRHCHHDHEEEAERGLHDGGGSGHGGGLGSPGGGGRGRVGVGVAARAGQGRVILVRAAKLAVSHVPAGLVRHAGELLQLGEVVAVAAVGAVAASSVGTFVSWLLTVGLPVLRAVHHRLHAEAPVDVPPVGVAIALQPRVAVIIRLACLLPVRLRELRVVLPWVAEVLEAGEVLALARAVAIVDAGGEGNLLDLTQTLDLTVGEGEEPGHDDC